MDFSKKYETPNPEVKANPISKLLYCWLLPLFYHGFKKDLEVKDLYNVNQCDISEKLGDTMERHWEEECLRAKKTSKKPEFIRVIRNMFIKPYSLYGIELFLQCIVLKMGQPLVLAELIKYFEPSRTMELYEGWIWALGVIGISFINVIIIHHASLGQARIGMQCRIATCSLIYRKVLRLNKASTSNTAAGQVVNLLSNDVLRFDLVPLFLHYIWLMPLQTVVAGVIMYNSIGYAAFAGIAALTIQAVPLQGYLSYLQGKLRLKIANRTDHRVQLMSEITAGIQVIKMYAWEKPFEELVKIARKLEIDVVAITSYIRGFLVALMVYTERFTLFLTIITYVLLGNRLTGDKVFSMAQFFNTIQLYMAIFYPLAVSFFAEAKVSVGRVEQFLLQEEIHISQVSNQSVNSEASTKTGLIKINRAKASWIPNPIVDTLTNINLNITPGTLCAVVGQVGAGKSSLLNLILRELPINSGSLEVHGNVSYASQEPWLFVSTVRNNILFGLPYVRTKYKSIVDVCALKRDFELLQNGDRTLVGERGVSLSGGQRARINLARSVYREADIYLFDDPLSAVDAHVGKHLFEQCIVKYLKDKTRILVTHQLQFLKHADTIVIMSNGQIEKVGTYDELINHELAHLQFETPEEPEKIDSPLSTSLVRHLRRESTVDEDEENEPQETQELVEKGAISSSLYMAYIREGGPIVLLLFFLFLLIIAQVACNGSDIWLTNWTNAEEHRNISDDDNFDKSNGFNFTISPSDLFAILNKTNESRNTTIFDEATTPTSMDEFTALITEGFQNETILQNAKGQDTGTAIYSTTTYIYVYSGLILASIVLTTIRSMLFFKICMNASKGLHNIMFSNVLKAKMRFFDSNPSGRILNRFSKDMGAVDEILPKAILDAVQIFMVMLGILIMVFIVRPWMIIPSVILAALFYFTRVIFLASAQNIKRLEGITRAPAFSHVSASLSGLATIRSSGAELMITKEFDSIQDQHTSAWFLFLAASEAFGFYLDIISVIFLLILTFQFLIFDDGTTLSGDVGLVISQSLILTGMLQFGIRQTAEVASHMTSVERIMQYTNLDKEGPFESISAKKPHRDWPKHGEVEFKKVNLSYISGEPVLNNLNFTVKPGEKVGIVGRTGAGKSSLIAALFRLAPTEGAIRIDDVEDIGDIGLHDLRSNISIIPQEPVLFSATLRHNLDPLSKSDDDTLWTALENVEMKQMVNNLSMEVKQGGANFSIGQRQLLCLARAIIRNNKILVMDEATANVDHQTDSLIQNTIRRNFKDCTVLTIAHRLNTVMDSDKVLVMDAGQAVEFAHPHELLQNPSGYLTSMLKETGPGMENKLRQIAANSYNNVISANESNTIENNGDNAT
ncbi:hypothetical protein PPYR_09119 [Photinus pyralis]|uniref:Uncharacterized protein n=1 Tax=Photinus pyralis TaxID=7054 RepID=A0A1Y1KY01_PHOPY|nr:probable multidrug resistance-associated protein lethal(2)03659 [Photinus pyralis]KAB0798126.1 hypothetical protein PPYR_09119 [Photinus pyralis]